VLAHIIKSKKRYNTSNNVVKLDFSFDDETIATARELIKVFLDNCWGKFDEYYKIFDLSPVYAAAVVLHLVYKWRYFEKTWTKPYQTI